MNSEIKIFSNHHNEKQIEKINQMKLDYFLLYKKKKNFNKKTYSTIICNTLNTAFHITNVGSCHN